MRNDVEAVGVFVGGEAQRSLVEILGGKQVVFVVHAQNALAQQFVVH